jgi:hypothetical protein
MTNFEDELAALIEETMAFAKSVRVETHAVAEPNRTHRVNWIKSEREEIRQRVANFRAHQERFMREREDYAAAELKRMWDRADIHAGVRSVTLAD